MYQLRGIRVVLTLLPALVTACDGGAGDGERADQAWAIDTTPSVVIKGRDDVDTLTLAMVTGATRLPNGDIMVADLGDFALLRFNDRGALQQRLARKGAGPGEVDYLARLFRCGNSLLAHDIGNRRTTVFTTEGFYVRSFVFGLGVAGRNPYASACNGKGTFVHHGWEDFRQIREGVFRNEVAFWLTPSDSSVGAHIGDWPGSERIGYVRNGRISGSGPLQLGKQPVVAMGNDRAYIGIADRYEFLVADLAGKIVDTLRRDVEVQKTTAADIAYAKAKAKAGASPRQATSIDSLWETIPFPTELPAYSAAIVDAADLLWVQDYARSSSPVIGWTVFNHEGEIVATVALPVLLEVYEIGEDYVLGRYLDPVVGEPEVHLYRLSRGVAAK